MLRRALRRRLARVSAGTVVLRRVLSRGGCHRKKAETRPLPRFAKNRARLNRG